MDTIELIQRLAVALAIGLIIGIERGWKQRGEAEGDRAAGLRTHALAGLLGGTWGAVAISTGGWGAVALGLAFAAFVGAMVVFRLREVEHERTYGATTMVAVMVAFALGTLAVVGDQRAAAAAAVAATMLLALKAALHEWVKRLTWEELRAGLILAAMTVIMLPLLPDRDLTPWFPVNPREVWLVTILIAALSFAGYVAIRVAGTGIGVLLSGIAGGLVSSTAVTLSMARLAREHRAREKLFAAGIILASAMMMMRVLVVIGVINIALLDILALPLLLAVVAQVIAAGVLGNWSRDDASVGGALELRNPFELRVVLEFGALLALIMALAKVIATWAGSKGAYALAAVSGIVDVDAVSISLARIAPHGLSADDAAYAILVAVIMNSATKVVLGSTAGGVRLGKLLAYGLAAAFSAGAIGVVIISRI